MSTMGVILSTVGDTQYCGDLMSTMGYSVPWGKNLLLFEYPTVLNTHTVLMISPTCVMISPTVLKFQRMDPHGTEHPHGTHDIPTCIMISPMVLSIPHSTQDNPHGTHDIPHGTEHPHGTQDIPTFIMISPTALNTPTVPWISPTILMISPTMLNTPRYCSPPTVLHTHYTGWFTNPNKHGLLNLSPR